MVKSIIKNTSVLCTPLYESNLNNYQNTQDLQQSQTEVCMCALSRQVVEVREDPVLCWRLSQESLQPWSCTHPPSRLSTMGRVHCSSAGTCQEYQLHPCLGSDKMDDPCLQMLRYYQEEFSGDVLYSKQEVSNQIILKNE